MMRAVAPDLAVERADVLGLAAGHRVSLCRLPIADTYSRVTGRSPPRQNGHEGPYDLLGALGVLVVNRLAAETDARFAGISARHRRGVATA